MNQVVLEREGGMTDGCPETSSTCQNNLLLYNNFQSMQQKFISLLMSFLDCNAALKWGSEAGKAYACQPVTYTRACITSQSMHETVKFARAYVLNEMT